MPARKQDTMNEKHIFLNEDRCSDAQGEAEHLHNGFMVSDVNRQFYKVLGWFAKQVGLTEDLILGKSSSFRVVSSTHK